MGKKLAHRLKLEFVDLDEYIEEREQKTVPQLYTELGDEGFRLVEWRALKEIVKKENIVISTGGGAPCHCDNMNLMEKYGTVIYIHLESAMLVSRLKEATLDRPIVLNKTEEELKAYVHDLRSKCEHHYTRAKYTVEGKDITVDKILKVLQIQADSDA
jgi:shikimate kinase